MHERVGKLESAGVIRAYRAEVEPEAIGLGVTALIGIVEDSGGDTDDVLETFRQMPEIESCYFMAGVESFLLKARVGTDRRAGAADRPAQPYARGGLHPHRRSRCPPSGRTGPSRSAAGFLTGRPAARRRSSRAGRARSAAVPSRRRRCRGGPNPS